MTAVAAAADDVSEPAGFERALVRFADLDRENSGQLAMLANELKGANAVAPLLTDNQLANAANAVGAAADRAASVVRDFAVRGALNGALGLAVTGIALALTTASVASPYLVVFSELAVVGLFLLWRGVRQFYESSFLSAQLRKPLCAVQSGLIQEQARRGEERANSAPVRVAVATTATPVADGTDRVTPDQSARTAEGHQ